MKYIDRISIINNHNSTSQTFRFSCATLSSLFKNLLNNFSHLYYFLHFPQFLSPLSKLEQIDKLDYLHELFRFNCILISQFSFRVESKAAYPKKKYLKISPKKWEKKNESKHESIKRNLAKQFRETKGWGRGREGVAVAEFMCRWNTCQWKLETMLGARRKTSALWSRAVTGTIDAIRRVTRISFAFPVTETPVAQSVNWLRSVSPFLRERCFTNLSSAGRLLPVWFLSRGQ